MMRDQYKSGLHLLMWVSGFVLLIACANVANLMLVRAASRRQHTSVRTALGTSRSRQMAQVMTESTVLGLLGGIFGVAIAFWCTRLILRLAFQDNHVAISAMPSLPVLGFSFGISLFTGILFGVAPAWMTAHADPADALRASPPFDAARRWLDAKIAGRGSGGIVAGSAVCRGIAHTELA
jgi:ABC-type antimicrobial peptide transport system permease subunit